MIFIIILIFLLLFLYLYWHFYYFFRDPDRKIPYGDNVVSPADGTVVYIKKIENSIVPISIKGKKEIRLEEILKFKSFNSKHPYWIVGIFMHPTDVHINRAPISGVIEKNIYTRSNNLPMTMMWLRVLLKKKPFELYSHHVFTNERNTICVKGIFPVYVVQIADIYVKKIESWIKEGDVVIKGQKIGIIKMGSQVDIMFPCLDNVNIVVEEGQKVKAGESIIATIE